MEPRSRRDAQMLGDSAYPDATPAPGQRVVVVTLPSEIDITNDGHVHDLLAGGVSDGPAVLVADGSGISFCGNCGVTALLAVHRRAAAAGTQLRVAASPALRRIVELSDADHVLDTYPTLAAALDGCARPVSPSGQLG